MSRRHPLWVRLSLMGSTAVFVLLSLLALSSCNRTPSGPHAAALQSIFKIGGKYAEDSMYGCLLDAIAQHISYKEALKLCQTKLTQSGAGGFGDANSPAGSLPGGGKPFDPSSITSSCQLGDPSHSAPSGGTATYIDPSGQNWGPYSWGSGPGYNGMSAADSRAAKEQAVREAKLWDAAATAATKAREETGKAILASQLSIPGAQTIVNSAYAAETAAIKKSNEANRAAQKDPNATPPPGSSSSSGSSSSGGSTSSSGGSSSSASGSSGGAGGDGGSHTAGDSACTAVLQAAREFLYECNRNGWKSGDCQKLNARMHHCPDPALILVDPDQGYTCGDMPDAIDVLTAWRDRCQQVARGVDGNDPCTLPTYSDHHITNTNWSICSDPRAYVDADSGACITTMSVPDLGPDIDEIIVIALEKIGGPIFVLPKNPKPPRSGPEPRPRGGRP